VPERTRQLIGDAKGSQLWGDEGAISIDAAGIEVVIAQARNFSFHLTDELLLVRLMKDMAHDRTPGLAC